MLGHIQGIEDNQIVDCKGTVNKLLHLKVHLFNWALYANNTSLLKREGAAATSANYGGGKQSKG